MRERETSPACGCSATAAQAAVAVLRLFPRVLSKLSDKAGTMSLDMFFQHFFNALTLGSLYGLIAIGYTMVYGILRLINFAHGDILMLGAYFVFYGTTTFFLPWGVAVVVAILAASAVGILVDRIAYRPLRDAPRISALISAIAVSFFIESLSVVVFSGLPRPVYQPEWLMTPSISGS